MPACWCCWVSFSSSLLVPQRPAPTIPGDSQQPKRANPGVRFTDVTAKAGIDFHHFDGASGKKLLPETMGGGVAVIDFDNDD